VSWTTPRTWVAGEIVTAAVMNTHLRDNFNALGDWTAVSFTAGDYTGNGAMTWTVEAGDVQNLSYSKNGKRITVAFFVQNTTVGGTPNSELRIAIPAGFTAAKATITPIVVNDNGSLVTGYAQVDSSGAVIRIIKLNGANYAAATNATGVYGEITFETTT
jgi:hypothetical protein